MKDSVLNPCPFCGNKTPELHETANIGFSVRCDGNDELGLDCNSSMSNTDWTQEYAIKLWNQRSEQVKS